MMRLYLMRSSIDRAIELPMLPAGRMVGDDGDGGVGRARRGYCDTIVILKF